MYNKVGSGGHYAKFNSSDKDRHILHGITYTQNLK